jgi:tripartite ATP-independent transporter DctP family solute receptor
MRVSRRAFLRAVGAATLVAPAAAAAQSPQTTIRFASLFNPDHSASRAADRFAQLVAQKTGGKVKVEVFHSASLGSEREAAEGVRSGSIDMAYSGLGGFGTFIPEIHVLEMPYLYEDLDEVKTVADRLTPELEKLMAGVGLHNLAFVFDGPRVTLATKPLRSLDDFKGLKFRVPQSPLYVQMARSFGATPTPVAFPEVYTALQTKIAEALEGSPTTLYTGKFHEVAKNLVRTDHIFYVAYVAMNPGFFAKQPPDVQKALVEAGKEATAYNLELAKKGVAEDLDRLKAAGVQFFSPDKAPFRAAVREANEKYAESRGKRALELYQQVRAITRR